MTRRGFLGGLLGMSGLLLIPTQKAPAPVVKVQFREYWHPKYRSKVLYAWSEIDGVAYEWADLISEDVLPKHKENARLAIAKAVIRHRFGEGR